MSDAPQRLVLLGASLGHSLSPRMQNAALRAAGIPLTYEPIEVPAAGLGALLEQLTAERAAGNVTIPHKALVARACVRRTGIADRVGAVNTFWTEADGLAGDNTDVAGFNALVKCVVGSEPNDASVLVMGAGGGAAAVCAAVEAWRGSRVTIWNRDPERAHRLAARFPERARAATDLFSAARGADIVVNATPVGLNGDLPIRVGALRGDAAVIDLVYRAGETRWVREARAAGHRAGDGLEMLIEQGACAFERWFGFRPRIDAMRRAVAA